MNQENNQDCPPGESLPDGVVVLRAGTMQMEDLLANVRKHNDRHPGEYALSCHAIPGLGINRMAKRVEYANGQLCTSDTDTLRGIGYTVVPDGKPDCHSNIKLTTAPTENRLEEEPTLISELGVIRKVFCDPPIKNRYQRKKKP